MGQAQGVRAGKAFVELGASDKLSKALKSAEKRLKAFGAAVKSIGVDLAGIGAGALAPLLASVKLFSQMGDDLDKMSQRTGVSVEALSELGFAAEQSGADMETLETGLRKMQKAITEAAGGSKSAQDALAQLGLTVADLVNLSPEQQFKVIAEQISKVEDPTRRAALAMEVFGKSGTRLLPLLKDGAKGIQELQQQAREFGLTVSTKTAKEAALLNDTLNLLWRVVKQGAFAIGEALAPSVIALSNSITKVVVKITDFIKRNKEVVVWAAKVAIAVLAVGAAMIAVGTAIIGASVVVGALGTVVAGLGTAFGVVGSVLAAIISPIGLVISAAVGLGSALLVTSGAGGKALAWLGEQFQSLKDTASGVITGITDALAAGDIGLAAKILWLALEVAWKTGVAKLNEVWSGALEFLQKTWIGAWAGIQAVAVEVMGSLETAWTEMITFLNNQWVHSATGFKHIWNDTLHWLQQEWIGLKALFSDDPGFVTYEAIQDSDKEHAGREKAIVAAENKALADLDSKRKGARDASAKVADDRLAKIGADLVEAQRKLKENAGDGVDETRKALEEARNELADALAKAKAEREAAGKTRGPGRTAADPLADILDTLTGIGSGIADKISVSGTFSAAAVSGLGAGSDLAKLLDVQQAAAKNIARIAKAADQGGLTFT